LCRIISGRSAADKRSGDDRCHRKPGHTVEMLHRILPHAARVDPALLLLEASLRSLRIVPAGSLRMLLPKMAAAVLRRT
jgi:hypothetical protein